MRVGIDLDGVVYNWHASLRQQIMLSTGRPASDFPEPEAWSFWEAWGLTLDEFIDHCEAGVNNGIIFSWGYPFDGVRDALLRIKEAGHTIHVVTDRRAGDPGVAARATASYLSLHGLPYDSLTFASDKTIVRLDLMVDDKLENYDALDAAGVAVYLMDRPWNQADDRERHRVQSMGEFADAVLASELEQARV
jgi:FMN phosphatase YigB (HAD superfamily)